MKTIQIDNISVIKSIQGKMLTATFTTNGLMSSSDKTRMVSSLPTHGSSIIKIGELLKYIRFYAVIYITSNNNVEAGLAILNVGYNGDSTYPFLKVISGKIYGKFFYNIDNGILSVYYKSPDIDSGPQIWIQIINGGSSLSQYMGTEENITEIKVL